MTIKPKAVEPGVVNQRLTMIQIGRPPLSVCIPVEISLDIGGSRIFLGGLKNEFIRMCNDCIAVKIQLLS